MPALTANLLRIARHASCLASRTVFNRRSVYDEGFVPDLLPCGQEAMAALGKTILRIRYILVVIQIALRVIQIAFREIQIAL